VSGTTISGSTPGTGAGGPPGQAPPSDPARQRTRLTVTGAVIAVATVLALGLRLYLLSRPGFLLSATEYDDGPYFGSALRLVDGVIPYRDFLLVQPPGITLLMVPSALLGKLTGTAWAMATGRLLTVLASTACVTLAGLLARHRGIIAVTLACGVTAVFPDAIRASHTVLVEPWLTLFCLIGALAVFHGDRLTASRRRLAWGGVAFGFAGAVEVWAIFPLAVVTVLLLRTPRRLATCLAGAAAGFLIPVLPIAAVSPRGFYDGLVVAQVGSRSGAIRVPVWYRVQHMFGLNDFRFAHATVLLAAVAIAGLVALLLILASGLTRQAPTSLEWFAVGSAVLVMAAFLWPPQFHYHFSAFLAPFVALSVALPAARLLQPAARAGGDARPAALRRWTDQPWFAGYVAFAAGLMIALMSVIQLSAEATPEPHVAYSTIVNARRLIPPGACVVTDEVSLTIEADRFTSDVPGCPLLVDSIGTDYALSHGRNPATGAATYPALVAVWRNSLERAQYVWLSSKEARRVPWTPALMAYFHQHFTQIMGDDSIHGLFKRNGPRQV
jgi:alpha-1,2-mannosyltransferase